ncbi:MAG: HD domain-containing protein, partial [Planctomycetota bacterium]
ALEGVEQPPQFHPEGDCWVHTRLVLEATGEAPPPELAWAALLHDIGKPPTFRRAERIRFDGHARLGAAMAERVLVRLGAPRALRETVVELVRDHLRFIEIRRMREARRKRFLLRPTAALHLALHRADCLGSHRRLDTWRWCVEQRARYEREREERGSAPLLTGRDLIAAGYRPGPAFGQILRAVEDAQLEGALADRTEALAWVRERFGPPPGPRPPERDAPRAR